MIRAQDLARAAGVSKTTVSYVFSPEKAHLISEATRQRVLETAQKLGYRPSFLGKALSMKRTYNVALILPARCATHISIHLLGILHGILECAEASEYNVSLFFGAGKRVFERLQDSRVDGIIVIGLASGTVLLDELAALGLPMTVVNRKYHNNPAVGCVYSDLPGWFDNAIQQMLKHNCRRICFFNKSADQAAGEILQDAAQETVDKLSGQGVTLEIRTLAPNHSRTEFGECFRMDDPYDGLIVNASEFEMIRAAATAAGKVPGRDFQLCCFSRRSDDVPEDCSWHYDSRKLGVCGWQMLMQLLKGERDLPPVILPVGKSHSRQNNDLIKIFDL